MVGTFITMITTLLITPSSLTTHLLAIFKVIEASLLVLNFKYFIARTVITLILAPPSTNILCNTDLLHYTTMIGSYSHLATITFKGVGTFRTLGVNNPFLNSFRIDFTIATNYPMVMYACVPHPSPPNKD